MALGVVVRNLAVWAWPSLLPSSQTGQATLDLDLV